MSNSFPRSHSFPLVPGTTAIEWFPNLVGWELRNQSGTGNSSSTAGTSHGHPHGGGARHRFWNRVRRPAGGSTAFGVLVIVHEKR